MEERVVCPQCGNYQIEEKWVYKHVEHEKQDRTFAAEAERLFALKKNISNVGISSGDLTFFYPHSLSEYSQLVLTCKDCGYTQVFDVE